MKKFALDSIKKKVFLACVGLSFIPLLCIIIISSIFLQQKSYNDFIERTDAEIKQFDNAISIFIEYAGLSLELMCSHPAINDIQGNLYSYTDTKKEIFPRDIKQTAVERELTQHVDLIAKTHPNYVELYLGNNDGGFISSDENSPIPPGYDPRKRPWYLDAIKNPGRISVANAYLSTSGENVTAVVKAFPDTTGKVKYAAGIDITLKNLTAIIDAIHIGKTGYMILVQKDGTIIAHPRNKELIFKKIQEIGVPELAKVISMKNGTMEFVFNGTRKVANVYNSPATGWIIIGIIDKNEILSSASSLRLIIIIFGILFVSIAGYIGFIVSTRLTAPIIETVQVLNGTAKGDFTKMLNPALEKRNDEIGTLARSFNGFITQMRDIISDLQIAFEQLAVSSEEIAGTISTFSDNIQSESASSEQITASTEQIASGMENVATSANYQNQTMEQLISQITRLSEFINEMNGLIRKTSDLTGKMNIEAKDGETALHSMKDSMDKIIGSSKDMASILKIINDISDQINLLSLNASIEAARAGEAGRGFAVVADEVSQLADQTAASLKEIGNLITINNTEIVNGQSGVDSSISLISRMIEQVNEISTMATKILSIMEEQLMMKDEVEKDAKKVKTLSDEIAHATGEDKVGIEEISKSVTDISHLSQNNAAGAEEVASSTEQLAGMAETLKTKIAFFKVK